MLRVFAQPGQLSRAQFAALLYLSHFPIGVFAGILSRPRLVFSPEEIEGFDILTDGERQHAGPLKILIHPGVHPHLSRHFVYNIDTEMGPCLAAVLACHIWVVLHRLEQGDHHLHQILAGAHRHRLGAHVLDCPLDRQPAILFFEALEVHKAGVGQRDDLGETLEDLYLIIGEFVHLGAVHGQGAVRVRDIDHHFGDRVGREALLGSGRFPALPRISVHRPHVRLIATPVLHYVLHAVQGKRLELLRLFLGDRQLQELARLLVDGVDAAAGKAHLQRPQLAPHQRGHFQQVVRGAGRQHLGAHPFGRCLAGESELLFLQEAVVFLQAAPGFAQLIDELCFGLANVLHGSRSVSD